MALRNFTAKPTLTTITTALNGTDAPGTSTTVGLASTANLPAAPFTAGLDLHQGAEEVVLVTAVAGGTATITRGYDGTAVSAHASGTGTFEHVTSAIDFTEANAHVNATTGVHGATGSLVDTGSVQTISGVKTFSAAPNIDADVHFSSAVRRTIYPSVTDVGLQVRSNGAGLLELNTDNIGDVKIAGGGGKTILGAGGLQLPRGASINTDGGTANTVLGSESTAGASFTDSVASDLIIKEPNGQKIRLGTHGASGAQAATVVIDPALGGGQLVVQGNGGVVGIELSRVAGTPDGLFGVVSAANNFFNGVTAGDTILKSQQGTLHLGVGVGVPSTLRVTTTDVQINDAAGTQSVPRGLIYSSTKTTNTTMTSGNGTETTISAGAAITYTNGRLYLILASVRMQGTNAGLYELRVKNGATVLFTGTVNVSTVGTTGAETAYIVGWSSTLSGSLTLSLVGTQTTGTAASWTAQGGATLPAQFLIFDMGA